MKGLTERLMVIAISVVNEIKNSIIANDRVASGKFLKSIKYKT